LTEGRYAGVAVLVFLAGVPGRFLGFDLQNEPDMSTFQRTLSKTKNSGSGPKKAASPRPDAFIYASARLASERGSRS
jgi:hypothetical protein